jgi:tetratricopeptide (TPR) repeat protein
MSEAPAPPVDRKKKLYRKAVGSRLRRLLYFLFGVFALLGVNSVYLVTITFLEWLRGETYQNYFYSWQFILHLALGLLITVPALVFGGIHIFNTYNRPNRRAVWVGYGLQVVTLVVLVSGFLLMRMEVFGIQLEIRDPTVRDVSYWAHVIGPLLIVWLYVLHRLAGRRIRWRIGAIWLAVSAVVAVGMGALHSQDPKTWGTVGPKVGLQYFYPSLARTDTGNFIPSGTLMMDDYCKECHPDAYDSWFHSAHRLASFNNPAYLASVRETRQVAFERDGSVQAARFCAGCHDPVPFLSGAFDDPNFDDVGDPTAHAGVTCTACHAITHVNSTLGNGDYTIEEPSHYPFTFSHNPFLHWVNLQLVRAKPDFHKKVFLKPLHGTAEFCGACHKVHLPQELNDYKWLRGQNLYDDFLLSGVSGHGAQSFYYPKKAEPNCNECHMKLQPSDDIEARVRDESGELKIHDHQFPSANTAVVHMAGGPQERIDAHERFNAGVMRVDVFGLREGDTLEGRLHAPLRPALPVLEPGRSYLLDVVVRTLKMGHAFTGGTVDSNEIWLDVTVRSGGRVIGRSGGRAEDGAVDPWSHFVNVYMLDRNGRRIDRRNGQDIFVPLYDHQIPPGAADTVHFALDLPEELSEPVTIDVALRYRKFDTIYVRFFQGEDFDGNDMPIMTLAEDSVTLPVGGLTVPAQTRDVEAWERWNDYGIGLLRKAGASGPAGELRQAEEAFAHVAELGRPDGPLNQGRVYLREGRLEEAIGALRRAARHDPPAHPWSVLWFTALVNKQNGYLDEAIDDLRRLLALDTELTRERGLDFALDYRAINELGQTLYERAKEERGEARRARRVELLEEARACFLRTLEIDQENLAAHYNLALLLGELGDVEGADRHHRMHEKYKPDDNARDRAVAIARRNDPAANHAAEAVVIYDLQRPGAFELP